MERNMMRKKITVWIMILCIVIAAVVVIYRRNLYPSPKEVTQAQLDKIFREDEDFAELFMDKIQNTQLACALEEPSIHQEKFYRNIMVGLQKFDYEVSRVSVSGDDAKATVSMNYFDLQEITGHAQKVLQDYLQENDSLSTDEMIEKLYEIIADEFEKGPSTDSKIDVTVSMHETDHRWVMEDQFADEIFGAILQQSDS